MSLDEFRPTKFSAHGQVEIQVDFPLLITRAEGPWNRELVDQWAQLIKPHAEDFAARGQWVGIGIFEGSMLCTAEAVERHREVVNYLVATLNAAAAAHVAAPEVEGESLMHSVFEQMFEGVCPYAQFQTLDDARAWAREILGSHPDA